MTAIMSRQKMNEWKYWFSHHKSIYVCLHLLLLSTSWISFILQKKYIFFLFPTTPRNACVRLACHENFIYLLITKIGPLNVAGWLFFVLNEGTNITHIRVMLCLINYSCIYIFGVSTFSIVSIQMKQLAWQRDFFV